MATAKKSPSLGDIIAAATPAERVVTVCVAGALIAEHQELERELEAAQRADTRVRLGQAPTAPKIAQRIEKLQERMREHTYLFRFRSLTPKRWADLLAEHPDPDGKRAFNVDTFPPAAIAACCVEPEGMGDRAQLDKLLDIVSPAQMNELFNGAWDVNTTAPKEATSYAASAVLRSSGTNSDTASPSESPEAPSSGT